MKLIEQSTTHHMKALGAVPADPQAFEDYKGLMADASIALAEAVQAETENLEELAFCINQNIWAAVSLGVARGLPMTALWEEFRRAVMTTIDPKTGKVPRDEHGEFTAPEGLKDMNLLQVLVDHGLVEPSDVSADDESKKDA